MLKEDDLMKNRRTAVACALLAMLTMSVLSGCTKKYDRGDIKQYVEETLGLKNFTVSRNYKEVKGPGDDYIDHLWEVTESDGTVFYVLDDYAYGTEWVTNSLRNNWSAVHLRKYLKEADTAGFEIEEPDEKYIMASPELTGTYSTRRELTDIVDRLNKLAVGSELDIDIPYSFKFDFPGRTIREYERTEADLHGTVSKSKPITSEYTEGCLMHLLLDMREEERLREFTEEEIRSYVGSSDQAIGIRNADGEWVMEDDLVASMFSYGISFPTLYEILYRSGYPVTGTKDDFIFTGADGSVYEMSESFIENESHYYIKDGVHVPMEYYFYDHFHVNKIKELTGIDVAERWMIEKENQSAEEG